MQASSAARKLHESLLLLHGKVIQATSQAQCPSCCSSSRSSSSFTARVHLRQASTGHVAAPLVPRRSANCFATDVPGSNLEGGNKQPLQPALYVVVRHQLLASQSLYCQLANTCVSYQAAACFVPVVMAVHMHPVLKVHVSSFSLCTCHQQQLHSPAAPPCRAPPSETWRT